MGIREEQQNQRLNHVLHYIEHNLNRNLDLTKLAEISGWSRWQLQRVFNATTGLSVAQYVRELRLSQSATQLISSNERHLDIAINAGFDSEASFSRAFKQHFHCTPRQYRKTRQPSGIRFPLTQAPQTHPVRHSIRIEQRAAFTLSGDYCETYGVFSIKSDFAEKVPPLWQAINQQLPDIPLLAVIDVANPVEGRLRYWVGSEHHLPEENSQSLKTLNVPQQLYAVVTHIGDLKHLHQTIAWFITHWLRQSPYEAFRGFDIEQYLPTNTPAHHVEYWIPIREIREIEVNDT
ncbi:helix-turn-helix domain-containing protein [Bacterioplanoides sp.]|uniref:helix-turn-helix domain-containing protein n=1 Tax=Bacterioplanoides sp. TaxID=2066072 RepID=UPI003AFFD579